MLRKQIIISFVIFAVLCATATLSLAQRTVNLNLNQEDVRITGETPGDSSGYALAYGDVDNDGFEDLIIGAPYAFDRNGKVYIIYGDANFSAPLSPQHLLLPGPFAIPHHLTTLLGSHTNDLFGWSVATGDINGDDTTDVLIGAPFALSTDSTCQYNFPEGGLTYVVYGGRLLKNVATSRVTLLHTLFVDVTEIHGGAKEIRSGWSVASGDINYDRYDDVIIGAPFADEAILDSIPGIRTDAGVTYIVYGDASLPVIPTNRFYLANPPSPITEIIGEMPGDNSGWSVSSGDINDDPSDEVIIGAPYAGNTFLNVGKTYVVSGISGSYLTTPFRLAFDLRTPPALIVEVFGGGKDDKSGWSVSNGNINQNIGKDDLIIGAPFADAMGLIDAGDTYVFFDAVLFPGNSLTVTNADFTIHGISEKDRSGWSVSSGDIENDGLDDILIGAPRADSSDAGYVHLGEAYAVFGQSILDYLNGGIFDISARRSNIIVYGDRAGDFAGFSVAAGNLNGIAGEDFSLGGPGADRTFPVRDAGETYVVYGCDTISVDAGNDRIICQEDSVILSGSATGGTPPYRWNWSPPTGLSDPNSQTTIAKPNVTTTYILTVTDSRGCVGKDEVKIIVYPGLVVKVEPDTTICHPNNGGYAMLRSEVTGGTPIFNYSWTPTTGLDDPASPGPKATPTVTTTYKLTVTDCRGCKGSDSLTVTVNPELVADAGADKKMCHPNNGGYAKLNGSATGGTPPYSFSWVPPTGLDDPNIADPTATPTVTTTYVLTVKDSRGCIDKDTVVVIVHPELFVEAGNDTTICYCDTVILKGSVSGGAPPYFYIWAPAASLDDPNSLTPHAKPTETTTYKLTAIDSFGCKDIDSVTVTVKIDTVAPHCRFVIDDDNNIIVNLYDGETGLAEINFLELINGYEPDLSDFEPGDHYVEFTIVPIDPYIPAIVTIEVKDFCGNITICDPVILTAKVNGPLQYEFDVSKIDNHLYVNNKGLSNINMKINDRSFELVADPTRRDYRGNRQYMPKFGDVCVEFGYYLTEENNHITIEVSGPMSASAHIVFSDDKLSITSSSLPQQFALYQNYPNPFNPSTTIEYTVPESFRDGAKVELLIYNIFGQQVKKLEDDFKQPGIYSVIWDGTDEVNNLVSSGIYFYRIKVGEHIAMKRMTFMK